MAALFCYKTGKNSNTMGQKQVTELCVCHGQTGVFGAKKYLL